MPPRKSTARQPSATPVRKTTLGANTLPDNTSQSRRSLRSTSQARDQANGVHTNLPEVQTQQSYAYGSTKTPLLPDQMRAKEKMSLSQMASTIDQQRSEADKRFRDYAVEVETNLAGQPEARNTRVTRRRASASPPREGSHDSDDSQAQKTQRTAAWASSLDSEQLQNITEEESDLIDDDNTRHGTDPSSFPSDIFDNSYNYERGLRRPRILDKTTNAIRDFFSDLGDVVSQMAGDAARTLRRAISSTCQAFTTFVDDTTRALPYIGFMILSVLTVAMVASSMCLLFCWLFRRTLCEPASTNMIQTTLRSYCGDCILESYTLPENMTPEQQADISYISKAVVDLRRQLQEVEKRIDSKLEAKYSLFSTSLDDLKERQRDIETHISKLERSTSPSSSPRENKINYFAPGTGAIINPMKSSPTLQRPPNFIWKGWQRLTGTVNYISNPPATALQAWEDLGDCWCAAGGHDIRLDVKMAYNIYPTYLTIEHIPSTASPDPDTAPREVEIWASFAHLSPEEYAEKGIWNLVGQNPIFPGMGKIGSAVYDIRPGVDHVQSFRLDINQGALLHATDEVTVRVVSNHGASRTCLYRVKLSGQPVMPHPTPVVVDG